MGSALKKISAFFRCTIGCLDLACNVSLLVYLFKLDRKKIEKGNDKMEI